MKYPMKFTHFGHNYLDKVNSYTTHSGVDFNYGRPYQDEGMPISSIADGIVEYIGRNLGIWILNKKVGWGNIVVIYHPEQNIYTRYAHLGNVNVSRRGERVKEGEQIGTCGKTGTSIPHLHFDIIKHKIKWTSYTKFMSLDRVRSIYHDPIAYINSKISQAEKKKKSQIAQPVSWAFKAWKKAKDLELTRSTKPDEYINAQKLFVFLDRLQLLDKDNINIAKKTKKK